MEPVPETERMKEFRASPVPSLRSYEASRYDTLTSNREPRAQHPPPIRRSTDPTPLFSQSPGWSSPGLVHRPQNTPPYYGGHARSRSTASMTAPMMSRAQSMPGVNAAGHLHMNPQRPSSPFGSPHRNRTPRKPVDEVFPGIPGRTRTDLGESTVAIPEEEDETPNALVRSNSPIRSSSPIFGLPAAHTLSKSRRSASPLRNSALPYLGGSAAIPTTPSSITSSPVFQSSKLNDSFSGSYGYSLSYSNSSVPSTPSSMRSRSPSISSLETIPDTPDAEEAALELERIAQLKAAADAADGDEAKRQSVLDTTGGRGRTLAVVYGSRDKRKRWSVCGAERRGDLDLETIWED